MKPLTFPQLKETVYYKNMDNGLDVYVLPKEGFHKTFATFTTKYGSIDNTFVPLNENKSTQVPDGIAHFLEHKMFEKEDGDVFHEFSKKGASANAFTSFAQTAYLFSATSHVKENLETLVNFVQDPYFTEETVEKEKGIIGQEIKMYEDEPDTHLLFGLLENMYHHHPVQINIAGTVSSISDITKDLLYTCYETFYHPSNMLLFVVGPVDANEIISLVEENQNAKNYQAQPPIQRFFEEEPEEVVQRKKVIEMAVQMPKCLIAFKDKHPGRTGKDLMKHELAVDVLLDLMFGESSENYEKLYNEGIIDDSFSFDYTEEDHFGFSMIGGDTKDPDILEKRLHDMIAEFKGQSLDETYIERVKKKKIGSFLQAMNSPEFMATQFTRYQFNDMNLFDVVAALEQLTVHELQRTMTEHFDEHNFTVCQVVPKEQ